MTQAAEPEAPINPYAVPSANLDPPPALGPVHDYYAPFYPMSPAKLVIMSVLTFGAYDLAFWWRQWSARRRTGEQLSVFWRTVFAGFTSFGFNNSLATALVLRDRQVPQPLPLAPALYLASLLLGRVIDRLSLAPALTFSLMLLAALVRAGALGVVQSAVNELLELEHYKGPFNRGLTAGSLVVGLLGILLWGGAVLGALVPSELSAP